MAIGIMELVGLYDKSKTGEVRTATVVRKQIG